MAEGDNIRVYLRVRPLVAREDARSAVVRVQAAPGGGAAVLVGGSRGSAPVDVFAFDGAGGPEASQAEVFEAAAAPVVRGVLEGYNGSVIAYGQTGSGKTHTMTGALGDAGALGADAGLMPRALAMLFREMGGGAAWRVSATYVEIYNEGVYDLLAEGAPGVSLREDARRGAVFVEGCREVRLSSLADGVEVILAGARSRHVAETAMNRASSRSHCVLTVHVRSERPGPAGVADVREARLHLVDLAGSERQALTAAAGARLKEAGSINRSLHALAAVVAGLAEMAAGGRPRHVPYRDSRLTFLLRDALGGNARTALVAAVSPAAAAMAESLSTLRFAARAKLVRNRAVANAALGGAGADDADALRAEVLRLRARVSQLERNGLDGSTGPIDAADGSGETERNGESAIASRHKGGGHTAMAVDGETASASRHRGERSTAMAVDGESAIMDDSSGALPPLPNHTLEMIAKRQRELLADADGLRERVRTLEEQLRRRERQVHAERMVARLRDAALASGGASDAALAAARAEAESLRAQLAAHPEVLQYAYEAMQARELVAALAAQVVALGGAPVSGGADAERLRAEAAAREAALLEHAARLERLLAQRTELANIGNADIESDSVPMADIAPSYVPSDDPEKEGDAAEGDAAEGLRRRAAELEDALSAAEARADRACDELAAAAQTRLSLAARLDDAVRRFSAAEAECARLRDEAARASAAAAEREAALLADRTDSATAHGRQLAGLRAQLAALAADMARAHADAADARAERDSLAAQLAALADGAREADELRTAHDALAEELEAARDDVLRLRRENDKLAAHSNVKQKLQYHMQIKEENNAFREEIRALRDELARLQQRAAAARP